MKLNLLIDNPGDVRSGYVNVDPLAPESSPDGRVRAHLHDLSVVVDDGEAAEIVALDVLDYFPQAQADDVLSGWLKKLAHGGRLTIGVVDLKEVARGVVQHTLSAEDVNELLHGKQEQPWQFRKASYTAGQLAEVLGNLGYKILARRVQGHRAVITVERP